jgi:hypothetical protein
MMCATESDHLFEKEFQETELKQMSAEELQRRITHAAQLTQFNFSLGLKTFARESACSLVWAIREAENRNRVSNLTFARRA